MKKQHSSRCAWYGGLAPQHSMTQKQWMGVGKSDRGQTFIDITCRAQKNEMYPDFPGTKNRRQENGREI